MPEASHPEPASSAEAANEIAACAERTLAAPSARVELHKEFRVSMAEWQRPSGWHGRVLRFALKTGKLLLHAGWTLATRHLKTTRGLEFGHMIGEGIAEPARGRYMIDFGSFAELHAAGKTFGGRSGRSLQTLHPGPYSDRVGDVLWLLRLLPGVMGATLDGTDTLRGTASRRFAAHVDLERASAATGDGLRPPPVERFEDLRALPVTVWIDGQHVRRIRFESRPPARLLATVDLWEFGVPVGGLDWSRLPTFRSPGYQQERQSWCQRVLRRVTAPAPGK
jgi:hypothetical protein